MKLYKVEPYKTKEYECIVFKYADEEFGFGEYTLFKKNNEDKWYGDSDYMDTNNDKAFLQALMSNFLEQIEIVEN